jgi:hypothetical protein
MRRTGRRVPDSKIASSNTAFTLYSQLHLQEKPKKLAHILEEEGRLRLPNVNVVPRKVTEVDTDVSKGRWKVIRKALQDRNLPEFASEPWESKEAQRKRHS